MEFTINIKDSARLPILSRPKKEVIMWGPEMEFYTDDNVKEIWTHDYGRITTITYMVYGDLGKRVNLSLNYAIRDTISTEKFAQLLEEVDWKSAELYGLYQGICIQWIFPDELKELDEVLEIITDGLEHFRIKNECIGATVDVYTRTT